MKKFILLVLIFSYTSLLAQKKYLDEISYQQANDITFFKSIKNGTTTNSYVFEDGNKISVGDTLTLGSPTSGSSYSNAYGGASNVNGTSAAIANIRTKNKKEYEFIIMGKPAGMGNIIGAMNGVGPARASVNFRGRKVLVNKIILSHRGSKKKPLTARVQIGEINGRAFGINKYLTVNDLDNAFSFGEIVIGNMKMTREQAIAKLKESKELLDLELLSQEEYDEIKMELTPIIRGNN